MLRPICSLVMCLLAGATTAQAQTSPPAAGDQSTYTFQASARVVLIDVSVTDAKGNPVHGLPLSAFHLFDNKEPQAITSFEEHDGAPATFASTNEPGEYSNDYLLHPPPVLNVVLIDIATMSLTDQMYLNDQLTRFINEQPEEQPLAIYLRAASGCFLVQNFTSDRKLLLNGLHMAIPRFPPPQPAYLSDANMLLKVAESLRELPGRKNVLWFSAGAARFLSPDLAVRQDDAALWRALYDDLNVERIALYPIDARGLEPIFNRGDQVAIFEQHMAMNGAAEATGGEAFYNNNGFVETTEHIVNSDTSFYTLSYSPEGLVLDNKWHKIRIAVGGASYHLSYRTGYFADGSLGGAQEPKKYRTRLLANAETLDVLEPSRHPIIFRASVLPASDLALAKLPRASVFLSRLPGKKGSIPYSARFTLPVSEFSVRNVGGKNQIAIAVVTVAINRDGDPLERKAERVAIDLGGKTSDESPNASITLDQLLNLAKDDKFLDIGVWDTVSGRFGVLHIPLQVSKQTKRAEPG